MLLLWEAGVSGWEAKVGEGLIGSIRITGKGGVRFAVTVTGRCASVAHAQSRVEALIDQLVVEANQMATEASPSRS